MLKWVTIVHPHHPLYQQRVEVMGLRRGIDPDLLIRLPDGTHAAVALSLTDFAGAVASMPPGEPLPLLDLRGLRHIAHWLEQRARPER